MLGRVLGHYRIEAGLGEGGMGVVYRARDEHLQRNIAIKVLAAGTFADQAARDRFRTEALSLSRLSRPNIETVYDFDTQKGVDFLVLEYLAGQPLSRSLAAAPRLRRTSCAWAARWPRRWWRRTRPASSIAI